MKLVCTIDLVNELHPDVLDCIEEDISETVLKVFNNVTGENAIKSISYKLLTEEQE